MLDLIVLKRNYANPGITLRNTQPHVLSEKLVQPFRSMVSPLGPEVLAWRRRPPGTRARSWRSARAAGQGPKGTRGAIESLTPSSRLLSRQETRTTLRAATTAAAAAVTPRRRSRYRGLTQCFLVSNAPAATVSDDRHSDSTRWDAREMTAGCSVDILFWSIDPNQSGQPSPRPRATLAAI